MTKLAGIFGKLLAFIKLHRKAITALALLGLMFAIVLIIQRAADYGRLKKENRELQATLADTLQELENAQDSLTTTQEQLAYSESQVALLEDSTNALVNQVGEMEKKVSDLEVLLNAKDTPPQIKRNQLEEQLVSLRELVTAKYIYTNATRQEASKTWLWGWTMPFSDISLLAAYDGTIKAGIDFSAITVDINERQRTITVTLPASTVTDNNIPQETINVLEVKNNLLNEVTFDDYNQFISAEKKTMEAKAIERGLLSDADEEARNTIKAFLSLIPGMDTYTLNVVTK